MPWTETLLPPLAGTIRAVSVGSREFVAWTEHGLFRYEVETYPLVRLLHPPAKAAEKFDLATGQIRWLSKSFDLIGDPAVVPNTQVMLCIECGDRRLEADPRR